MTTQQKALRLALEALEINLVFLRKVKPFKGQEDLASDCVAMTEETINAIKEALETKDEPVSMRMPKVGDRVVCIEDESLGVVHYLTAGGSPEIKFDDGSHGTYLLREFAELFGYADTTPQSETKDEPKLIGWRTADFLNETTDIKSARNWEVHYEVLPIFEGDPNTKLVTTPQPKQEQDEPVAVRYDFDGYGYKYIDNGSGSDWKTRIKDAEPLYTTPQPKQETKDEPVYWEMPDGKIVDKWALQFYRGDTGTPLYTTPQRTWVGLTDEEIDGLHEEIKVRLMGTFNTKDIYRAVEAKLKERNI